MAQHIAYMPSTRRVGKTRNPWGVWLLALVTLGIYLLWWYYTINNEIREYTTVSKSNQGLRCWRSLFRLPAWSQSSKPVAGSRRHSDSPNRTSAALD